MKRQILILCVITLFVATTWGNTLIDGFNDGLSQHLWEIESISASDVPWAIEAPDSMGRLKISKSIDEGQSSMIYTTIRSQFALGGDLSVKVDFDISAFPLAVAGGWNETGLSLVSDQGIMASVIRFTNPVAQSAEGWTELPPHAFGAVYDSTMQGKFQITRIADTISVWIDRGFGPVLLGSTTSPDYLSSAKVELFVAQVQSDVSLIRPHTALNVSFDNFTATADIIIIPEPCTLLLLGLGGLLIRKR